MNNSNQRGLALKGGVLSALIVCGFVFLIWASVLSKRADSPTSVITGPTPGTFGALTFSSLDGARVPMSRYLGKPMLVEIWATWCGPCVKARKELHALASDAEPYANLIALSVDRGGMDVVNQFLAKKNEPASPWVDLMADDPKFRSVIGPHDVRATIPKLIYVDAGGQIVDIEYGIPESKWVLNRLKALASAGTRG